MPPPVSDGSLIAFGLLAAAVAIRKVYRMVTSPREKSKRRLTGTRRTRTGELHNGLARIAGKALGREVLRAPVTDRACLAFELRVERDVGDDAWEEVLRFQDARAFTLVDETGEAQVEPGRDFEVVLAADRFGGPGKSNQPHPPDLAAVFRLLNDHGIPLDGALGFARTFRYEEAILPEGGLVTVYGAALEEVHPEGERGGPRGLPIARVMRGTVAEPLRIGDWQDPGSV